ncbi:hypothetical protein CR513_42319, partial [Mucuna pruriens]
MVIPHGARVEALDGRSIARTGLLENIMKNIPNIETYPRTNNTVLVPNDTDKFCRQDEGEEKEEEALRELKRLLEQEKPKL